MPFNAHSEALITELLTYQLVNEVENLEKRTFSSHGAVAYFCTFETDAYCLPSGSLNPSTILELSASGHRQPTSKNNDAYAPVTLNYGWFFNKKTPQNEKNGDNPWV